jgi:hypothetical protein
MLGPIFALHSTLIAIYNNADTTPTQVQTQMFNLCIGAN